MLEAKTHFEQVSLEVVRKITEDQLRQEEVDTMRNAPKEQWIQLCEQASTEQDSQRLLLLVREINELLEKKHGTRTKSNRL